MSAHEPNAADQRIAADLRTRTIDERVYTIEQAVFGRYSSETGLWVPGILQRMKDFVDIQDGTNKAVLSLRDEQIAWRKLATKGWAVATLILLALVFHQYGGVQWLLDLAKTLH